MPSIMSPDMGQVPSLLIGCGLIVTAHKPTNMTVSLYKLPVIVFAIEFESPHAAH